jgi:hypothetical protein
MTSTSPYRDAPPLAPARWSITLSRPAWWIVHAIVLGVAALFVVDWVRDCYRPDPGPHVGWIYLDFRKFFAAIGIEVGVFFVGASTVVLARARRRLVWILPLAYVGAAVFACTATYVLLRFGVDFEAFLPEPP